MSLEPRKPQDYRRLMKVRDEEVMVFTVIAGGKNENGAGAFSDTSELLAP